MSGILGTAAAMLDKWTGGALPGRSTKFNPDMYNPAYSRQPDDGIVDAEFEELPQLAIESKD